MSTSSTIDHEVAAAAMSMTMTTNTIMNMNMSMSIITTTTTAATIMTMTMSMNTNTTTMSTAYAAAATTITAIDADEVFTSWGMETAQEVRRSRDARPLWKRWTPAPTALSSVPRASSPAPTAAGCTLTMVPGEHQVRRGAADYTGRLCVIGSQLKEGDIQTLFQL